MTESYPILSIEEARAYEESVLQGDLERTGSAMTAAGRAIGRAILNDYREIRDWPERPLVQVLCGKGLNTGDALVACETLFEQLGRIRVQLVMLSPQKEWNPLAARALERLRGILGESLQSATPGEFLEGPAQPADLLLDGLYGLGFEPPLRDEPRKLLQWVNQRRDIRLRASVDLPSGIGEDSDPDSFVADFTYIPGVAKAPAFWRQNQGFVGRVRFLRMEAFREQPSADGQAWHIVAPDVYRSLNVLRSAHADKRAFGHVLVLAGSASMPGAALMSTLGALHSGAGLVTTLCPSSVINRIAGQVPEAMWRSLPQTHEGGLDVESVRVVSQAAAKSSVLLVGPGMVMDRPTLFAVCRIIRENPLPLVLDASALVQDVMTAILARPASAGPVILTPHHGEFSRILGLKEEPPDDDSLLFGLSRKYQAITLLKGSPTRVCDGEHIYTVPVGGPVLARGGSGDILSGMLATLLAQDVENPLRVALRAITWHGAAADALARARGAVAVRTTELLSLLPTVLRN